MYSLRHVNLKIIFTETEKVSLSFYDNKRYIFENYYETFPFGHYTFFWYKF